LTDENTHKYCLPHLLKGIAVPEIPYEILKTEAGEAGKNVKNTVRIWENLSKNEADRNALVINLGGGVITDLGGFAASVYKRGIRFVNVPTTLLAMVDASVGGKTGIDLDFVKNIIGTFAEAEEVFIVPKFLKSLKFKQLRSGFAEMLKHGIIADRKHWEALISIKKISPKNLAPFVEDSMRIKENIVNQDFKEKNLRKILNYGHTIGHAVESLFLKINKPVPHGEAVAMGMISEAYLAHIKGIMNEKDFDEIRKNILKFFPKLELKKFKNKEIFALMTLDKKNADGEIRFSLPETIGKCRYDCKAAQEKIFEAIDFYREI
jgi:3-dehydroquinate synthase